MSSVPHVLDLGDGRVLDMGPFRMTAKAAAFRTEVAFTLLEADEPPGLGPPMHVHDDAGEAFYVLAGEYIVFISGEEHRCPAGSLVWGQAGVEHGFWSANHRAGSSTFTFLQRWKNTSRLSPKLRPRAQ
jgi:mannose-6-phosphate isomerase-like protein (cupin superfamily)